MIVGARRLMVGLGGGSGAAGTTGGLRDLTLGAESALLMVAAVWLEYPESLAASGPTFSTSSLSALRSLECERLAPTLASLGAGDPRFVVVRSPSSE